MTKGWKNESRRHSLARQGIKTKTEHKTAIKTPSYRADYTVESHYPMYVKLTFDEDLNKKFYKLRSVIDSSKTHEYLIPEKEVVLSIEKADGEYIIVKRRCTINGREVIIPLESHPIAFEPSLQQADVRIRELVQLEIM